MSGGARSRMQFDGSDGRSGHRQSSGDEGEVTLGDDVGELVVVDVGVDGFERDVGRAACARQRVEERGVGLGIPEVAALGVGEREARARRDDVRPARWPR